MSKLLKKIVVLGLAAALSAPVFADEATTGTTDTNAVTSETTTTDQNQTAATSDEQVQKGTMKHHRKKSGHKGRTATAEKAKQAQEGTSTEQTLATDTTNNGSTASN